MDIFATDARIKIILSNQCNLKINILSSKTILSKKMQRIILEIWMSCQLMADHQVEPRVKPWFDPRAKSGRLARPIISFVCDAQCSLTNLQVIEKELNDL